MCMHDVMLCCWLCKNNMTLLVYTTPDAATVSHKTKPQAAIETQLLLPSKPAQDTYVYTTQVF